MAASSAATRGRVFDAAVQGCERGEYEKQQRVRCRVQRKVEEAVDQYCKAAGERTRRDAAAKFVSGLTPGQPHAKQRHDEEQPQRSADDAGIRQHLQVIVVRLLESVQTVV